MARLFLLDAMGLAYRAYYAFIRRPLVNSKGQNTSAIYGLANMLLKIRREERPEYWVLAWDGPGPTFRDLEYPQYKATRPPMPEDLLKQMEPIQELAAALGLPLAEIPGAEADDVMATLARRGAESGMEVALVTSDKDMLQLVGGPIRALMPQGKGEEATWVDAAAVEEKWGVEPARMRDVLALMGDSVDNIPGVPGVGEKTAVQLIKRFGSLEELYRRLDEVERPALRQKLAENREAAFFSRRLVTLKDDLSLPWSWEELRRRPMARPALRELGRRLELKRLERLADEEFEDAPTATMAPPAPPAPRAPATPRPDESEASSAAPRATLPGRPGQQLALAWEVVEERPATSGSMVRPGALGTLAATLRAAGSRGLALCAISTGEEPRGALPLGLALAVRPDQPHYVPLGHEGVENVGAAEAREALAPLLEAAGLVGHDLKSGLHVLGALGLAGRADFDLMLASYVCDPVRAHDLAAVARDFAGLGARPLAPPEGARRLPRAQWPVESVAAHAADVVRTALLVRPALEAQIEGTGQNRVFREIEMPLVPVLLEMEQVGVSLDREALRVMGESLEVEVRRLEQEAHRLAGEPFNLNSSPQLQAILFEKLGLKGRRKTKTGYSTDQDVLEELAAEHPLPRVLIEYRLLSKLKSTYVDALPVLVDPADGRLHTTFNQAVASTGRLSSSNPNLQNIPMRTEQGRAVRRAFVAPPGRRLVGADYSQIELRVMAHLSGDARLREAFLSGEDVHARTARRIFNVTGEVSPVLRARAKIVNFGVMYGMGAKSLAQQMEIAVPEATAFIEDYFRVFEGVRRFLDRTVSSARERGYVTTLFGRRRYLPALQSPGGFERSMAERAAINAPLQGTAADLMKLAMIRVARALREEKRSARLLLQVHDELLLEVPEREVEDIQSRVRHEMENVWPLEVPLVVSVGAGESWLDVH
jgi:DNA polymerase-1